MAIKLDELQSILIEAGVDQKARTEALKIAQAMEDEKKEEREVTKGPKLKNEFVILVRGDAELAKTLQQGWIVSVKEGDDTNTLVERMKTAAREQNNNVKKNKWRVHTWIDLFNHLKRLYSKGQNFQPKTKQSVRVIVLENEYLNE